MWGLFVALREAARIGHVRRLAVGFAVVALSAQAAAAADKPVAPGAPGAPGAAVAQYDSASWAGLNWGLGIAANFDVGGTRVANASIITSPGGSIVRVNDTSSNVDVSFVLEMHYFLRDKVLNFNGPGDCTQQANRTGSYINCTEMAWGPFIAIEVGGGTTSSPANNGPITGYALGWMVGFHHPFDASGKTNNTSWNLGVGLRIDPKAQVLGDGFVANMAPPAGETAIRYKTEPRAGVMLLSSFSF
jgi:hypothetical protein